MQDIPALPVLGLISWFQPCSALTFSSRLCNSKWPSLLFMIKSFVCYPPDLLPVAARHASVSLFQHDSHARSLAWLWVSECLLSLEMSPYLLASWSHVIIWPTLSFPLLITSAPLPATCFRTYWLVDTASVECFGSWPLLSCHAGYHKLRSLPIDLPVWVSFGSYHTHYSTIWPAMDSISPIQWLERIEEILHQHETNMAAIAAENRQAMET